MISVDGKGAVTPVMKLKIQGVVLIKIFKKHFRKDLMSLIETNHQTNILHLINILT